VTGLRTVYRASRCALQLNIIQQIIISFINVSGLVENRQLSRECFVTFRLNADGTGIVDVADIFN